MKLAKLAVVTLAFGLAACGADAPNGVASATGAQEQPDVKIDPQLETFVAQARQDLAGRLDIEKAQIELVDAGFVTWPSSALGCPEPDTMYMQALVSGYRIRLRAGEALHHYHGAADKPPFHCPGKRVTSPATVSRSPNDVT